MPFQPGQSGNPNGRPPNEKVFRSALDKALKQDDGKKLRAAAESLLTLAAQGEGWAVKELRDTLDGKPAQALIVAGDKDQPLTLHHKIG